MLERLAVMRATNVMLVCLGLASAMAWSACSAGETPVRRGGAPANTIDGGSCVGCAADGGTSSSDSGVHVLRDAAATPDAATEAGPISTCPDDKRVAKGCMPALPSESVPKLCNALDDDCDGFIDEGCGCTPGQVRACFGGPPGLRNRGACADGMQRCVGAEEFGMWGPCEGGIVSSPEVCDGLDNDCNGCADDIADCTPTGTCPAPGDARVPDGAPFRDYPLHGTDFFSGAALSWLWTIKGGPCDELSPTQPSFTLSDAQTDNALFEPKLSGDYSVTLTVTRADHSVFTCTWIVHVKGPGLRVEMCYPENTTQDLDLYLKQPGALTPWFTIAQDDANATQFEPAGDECCWASCEAAIRSATALAPNWGYAVSPLSACEGGPQGTQWQSVGSCRNPRLDIDNNLSEGIGLPENINVDAPKDAETFRIMVANFTGTIAHPLVNVYCGGSRVATFGAAPDQLPSFMGDSGDSNVGAMWRVADVQAHVGSDGAVSCNVTALHPPATSAGFDVTYNDPRY